VSHSGRERQGKHSGKKGGKNGSQAPKGKPKKDIPPRQKGRGVSLKKKNRSELPRYRCKTTEAIGTPQGGRKSIEFTGCLEFEGTKTQGTKKERKNCDQERQRHEEALEKQANVAGGKF